MSREIIESGKAVLGIEFGSTRIKAVLIDPNHNPIASGSFEWENKLENGYWTYSMEGIHTGLKTCYGRLRDDVAEKYQIALSKVGAIGISGMMHGYLAFDKDDNLLVPFRTWRNGTTGPAAETLTELFGTNIPQRWSIAHLYQAILNEEEHVKDISYLTTLAGYIHWQLTGKKVMGIGEASGMFPVDPETKEYYKDMVDKFNGLISNKNLPWTLTDILPQILVAGEDAGTLTEKGVSLLDETATLETGILLCPPEGDAGTGMVATNSVKKGTGNVSAGTSVFANIVLEKELDKVHMEIDPATTPDGNLVGMVHANNCTSDLNAWVGLFGEFAKCAGMELSPDRLFGILYNKALEGDVDCGGLLSYGYISGENITGIVDGRPLFARTPESNFNLANFMRTHLYTSLAALKVGMDILQKEEGVTLTSLLGHGGLFKTPVVGQKILAAAVNTPITVMETAGEGGPWGMALLASYMLYKEEGESLEAYLDNKVFGDNKGVTLEPDPEDALGFELYTQRYLKGVAVEAAAEKSL